MDCGAVFPAVPGSVPVCFSAAGAVPDGLAVSGGCSGGFQPGLGGGGSGGVWHIP